MKWCLTIAINGHLYGYRMSFMALLLCHFDHKIGSVPLNVCSFYQMEKLGEKVEHFYPEIKLMYFSTPVSPLQNIYLPHCLRLVQIKLRIGHAMARNAAKNIRAG